MREMTIQESMNANGGKTYICPFGCNKTGSYLSVYTHCLTKQCFRADPWLNSLWIGAKGCLYAAKGLKLVSNLKKLIFPTGKHFK